MLSNRHGVTVRNSLVFLGLLTMAGAAGWAFAGSPEGGRAPGPPPEAFKACEGKRAGDVVQLATSRGDTISATCSEMRGGLVAMPEGEPHDRRPGVPAEAFKACKGKNAGETVQIQTPRGDTISGTCREMQGQLVAVPAGGPHGRDPGPPPDVPQE